MSNTLNRSNSKQKSQVDIRQLKQIRIQSSESSMTNTLQDNFARSLKSPAFQEFNLTATSFLFSKSTQNYFTNNQKSFFFSFKKELTENAELNDLLKLQNEKEKLQVQLQHNKKEMRSISQNLNVFQKANMEKIFKEAQEIEKRTQSLRTKIRSYKKSNNFIFADEELVYTDFSKLKQNAEGSPKRNINIQQQELDQGFQDNLSNENTQIKAEQNQNEQENYHFFCLKVDFNSAYSPAFREGASLNYLNGNLYLYGGLGEEIRKEVDQFDLVSKQWKKLEFKSEYYPHKGMFGHTAVTYKDNFIIIYGGQSQFNSKLKQRHCFSDVWSFDVLKCEWSQVVGFGSIPEQRRNHSSVVKENLLITLGGVSNNDRYLSDIQTLNLDLGRWKTYQFDSIFHDGIAFHKIVAVFISKNQMKNKKKQSLIIDRLKYNDEGIYCYGGKNRKGKLYSQMMVLKFVKENSSSKEELSEWQNIQTIGKQPPARFDHSMDYIEALNCLVIFGGIGETQNRLAYVHYNDLWIFKISTKTWVQINFEYLDNVYRSGHASCALGSQIFFFGGLQEAQYSNCFLYYIETDNINSYKLKRAMEGDDYSKDVSTPLTDFKFINQQQQQLAFEQAKQNSQGEEQQISHSKFPLNFKSFAPLPNKFQLKSLRPINLSQQQENQIQNTRKRQRSLHTTNTQTLQNEIQQRNRNISSLTPRTNDNKQLFSPISFNQTGSKFSKIRQFHNSFQTNFSQKAQPYII
ncbi:kelch motif protein (macronuclear) [Tetrahymena thermophila SB210]|uniref:Kelch motif protein n=1 Tax=Tetrahymena thermophila (strain SB210) TaxID=312017 RepID=Q24DL5_TETTS|nr:kelch motif protein [Tetrahymena thermophila SB210]EAS05833.2 kelch motif protein [Tetrahymena thermophila SB210]|eukprot:XP_001026078.2 kelch motif protein [Tetrahymena thermophila SB210]